MNHSDSEKNTISMTRIVCTASVIGSAAVLIVSFLRDTIDSVAIVALVSVVLFAAAWIFSGRVKRPAAISLSVVAGHIIAVLVMWHEYSMMNYFVSIYTIYTVLVLVLLCERKTKLLVSVVMLALAIAMVLYDVFSEGDYVSDTEYFSIVIGSLIIGMMAVLIARQYAKYLQRLNEKLYLISVQDPLTGAYNFRHLKETLDRCHGQWQESGIPFGIALIDIDDFKLINDTYGHLHGDEFLREFVDQIRHTVRQTDMVFRYGGDEFVILFPGTPPGDVKIIMDRVAARLQFSTRISFSAGVSHVQQSGAIKENLLAYADQRLYHAKQAGKQQVVY